MRKFALNTLLVLISCLLGLIALEAVAWFVAPPPKPGLPRNMLVRDERGLWLVTPGYTGVMDNRVDFRDAAITGTAEGTRLVPAAPQRAARTLWVIGDSQTFGHGLSDEESWPNQLQRRLAAQGRDVKVVNLGIPGINIDQYDKRLSLMAEDIRPGDQVLLGLSWNDLITPPSAAEVNKVVEGYVVRAENVQTAAQAEATAARLKLFEDTGIVVPPFQDLKSFLDAMSGTSALVGILYPRAKALYYRLRSHSPVGDLVAQGVPEANMALVRGACDKAEARGASCAALLLPERMFFLDEAFRVYSAGGRDFPTQDYQAHLALPACAKLGLTCLNAFPVLHGHQRDGLVFPIDGHYNARGAALVAEFLAGRL